MRPHSCRGAQTTYAKAPAQWQENAFLASPRALRPNLSTVRVSATREPPAGDQKSKGLFFLRGGRRRLAIGVTSMNLLDRRSHVGDQSHAIAGVRAGQQPDLLVRFGRTRVALCGLRRIARVSLASNMRRDNVGGRGLRGSGGHAEGRQGQKNRQLKSPHRPLHRPGASLARSRDNSRALTGKRDRRQPGLAFRTSLALTARIAPSVLRGQWARPAHAASRASVKQLPSSRERPKVGM